MEWYVSLRRTRRSARRLFARLRSVSEELGAPYPSVHCRQLTPNPAARAVKNLDNTPEPSLRRLSLSQPLPDRIHHDRHPFRLIHDHLHAHILELLRRRLGNPARHHDDLGISLA